MMTNQNVLKIHPAPLSDLLSGAKTAEVRRNDRGFQVGDTVRLMEVNPETLNWTGRPDLVRTISHIQTGYGLPDGMCVLSYAETAQRESLARVEAERDALRDQVVKSDAVAMANAFACDTAQAQLEEALTLIRDAKEGLRTGPSYGWEDRLATQLGDFLARHAQAEQQEAQGAQAGDELERLSVTNILLDVVPGPDGMGHEVYAKSVEQVERRLCDLGDKVEDLTNELAIARAALATQPSVEVFGWYWQRSFRGGVVNTGFSLGALKPELGEETYGKHRTSTEYVALVAVEPAVRGAEHDQVDAWNRRAAKPAAGEPVAYISAATIAKLKLGKDAPATLFAPPIPEAHHGIALYAAPPAAAHGDDAVWVPCSEHLPDIANGGSQHFLVSVYRAHSGESSVFEAHYLRDYPLYNEALGDETGEYLATGWFNQVPDIEFDEYYEPVARKDSGDEVTHWMPMPKPAAAMRAQGDGVDTMTEPVTIGGRSAANATHELVCQHCCGWTKSYAMRCHILKTMPDGRFKVLVFGERNWKDRDHIVRTRYVESGRVLERAPAHGDGS